MILIGCEESQVVCTEFLKRGFKAYSCDLVKTRGKYPKNHIIADVKTVIPKAHWDLIILHPDCTALALSGNRWYAPGKPKYEERKKAIEWTVDLWNLAIKHSKRVALENPRSVIWKYIGKPQYIQPWQFGHGEVKLTGLRLHNLPELKPTNIVEGREARVWKMGQHKYRKRDRSVTYKGIAEAMANQWGKLL